MNKCNKCLFNNHNICSIYQVTIDMEDNDFLECSQSCWFFRHYITMKSADGYSDLYDYDENNEIIIK